MRVVFRVISTGGVGTARVTRYIAEHDKDPLREGPGPRPLFTEDRDGLTYRTADRVLDADGQPQKGDLLHFSVSLEEADFEKLGADEKEKQARFREVVREGMKGMVEELDVTRLTWVAGIHRNTDNPHAHIVVHKQSIERATGQEKRIHRIPKRMLPHKEMREGTEILVPGRIGDRFLAALEKQQALYLSPEQPQTRAQEIMDQLIERFKGGGKVRTERGRNDAAGAPAGEGRVEGSLGQSIAEVVARYATDKSLSEHVPVKGNNNDVRIALGRQFELSMSLRFAQAWYDRAVEHGDTYRFDVLDQSTTEERKISEFDVHRRAAARAQHFSDHDDRERAYAADLGRHQETLGQLREVREKKIDVLAKDLSAVRGKLTQVTRLLSRVDDSQATDLKPIIAPATLSELQAQAVKLTLPETVKELEDLRLLLTEGKTPTRTVEEIATLAAQLNTARADYLARDKRLDNFEASVHLVNYEVGSKRWSLATLDKQITRRREDARIIPERTNG